MVVFPIDIYDVIVTTGSEHSSNAGTRAVDHGKTRVKQAASHDRRRRSANKEGSDNNKRQQRTGLIRLGPDIHQPV